MSSDRPHASKRVREPYDRISEALFGLIMVLTFTGGLSVAAAGRDDARTRLIGAPGCNIARGIIDGLLYLMGCLSEPGRRLRPWLTGVAMVGLGTGLVALTMALGG